MAWENYLCAKIIQIIPAGDYVAVCAIEPTPQYQDAAIVIPVVCWALVELEDGSREVVGMDLEPGSQRLHISVDVASFVTYARSKVSQVELNKEALDFLKTNKEIEEKKLDKK